jgi:phospholipase/carboxylesterase
MEAAMAGDEIADLVAILPPLLQSLETLGFVGRYLNPPDLPAVLKAAGRPDDALRAELPRLERWPENLDSMRARIDTASEAVLGAYEGLRAAPEKRDGVFAAYRALGQLTRAQETLYPLAVGLPPVNRYFLDPETDRSAEMQARTLQVQPNPDTGVFHIKNGDDERGGFSMYVPEYYTPDREWPLVFALHGGSGNGRGFLWSWLRTARAYGAILVSPTSTGETWALNARDSDTPFLARILDGVTSRWSIDRGRMLMTGMSDGGTFTYMSGLRDGSPFTHLAPISAAFHPLMAQLGGDDGFGGRPIHIVHGALDWMFPIETARNARDVLTAAGANVTFREIADLSHTYPREVNLSILQWMDGRTPE